MKMSSNSIFPLIVKVGLGSHTPCAEEGREFITDPSHAHMLEFQDFHLKLIAGKLHEGMHHIVAHMITFLQS